MEPSIEETLTNGIEAHKAGLIDKADEFYTTILNSHPKHPDANHNKGILIANLGRTQEALSFFKNALEANSKVAQFWQSYIEALIKLDRFAEARAVLSQAKSLGAHGEGLKELDQWLESKTLAVINASTIMKKEQNVLTTLKLDKAIRLAKKKRKAGDLSQAEKIYRDILIHFPQNRKALEGLKVLSATVQPKSKNSENPPVSMLKDLINLSKQGKFRESKEKALALVASYPNSYSLYNLIGGSNQGLGKLEEAINSYKTALALKPNFAEAYYNMGNTLNKQGRAKDAIASYRKAVSIKSNFIEAYNNLGKAFQDQDNLSEAVAAYHSALLIDPNYSEALYNLGGILRYVRFQKANPSVQNSIKLILDKKTVARPSDVSAAALSLLKLDPAVKELLHEYSNRNLKNTFKKIILNLSNLPLLLKLMSICPISDLNLELALTKVRSLILASISENPNNCGALDFQSALALQCFTNEYIYTFSSDDHNFLKKLESSVSQEFFEGKQPSPQTVLCLASFKSLNEYDWSDLLEVTKGLEDVYKRQVLEPTEERRLKLEMKILNDITDGVSSKVRNQYESNPYPRWVNLGLNSEASSIEAMAKDARLKVTLEYISNINAPKILIAGCGTGQHSIGTATKFKHSQVLAIDLSLSSLAYAKRKTKELSIKNIDYMQADILDLKEQTKKFDVIESVGVLHHMKDPMAGWRVLTECLKPGGLMRIGLYSELARKSVADIRENIFSSNLNISDKEILSIREKIIFSDKQTHNRIKSWNDFYSLSELRDLLFHVQEHRFTIPHIKDCLNNLGLMFCGFDGIHVQKAFLEKNDKSLLYDLNEWNNFEQLNPGIFAGMYQFWCQKPIL